LVPFNVFVSLEVIIYWNFQKQNYKNEY